MKTKLERHNGKTGNLVLCVVAETEADRVALRELLGPLKGQQFATVPLTVCVRLDALDPNAHVDDLGPGEITLAFPAPAEPAPARREREKSCGAS